MLLPRQAQYSSKKKSHEAFLCGGKSSRILLFVLRRQPDGHGDGGLMLESAEPSGRRSNMKRRDFLKSAGGAAATATAGDTFSGTHQIFLAAGSRQQLHGIWSTAPYSKLLTPAGSSR